MDLDMGDRRDVALLTLFPPQGGIETRVFGRRIRPRIEWPDGPPSLARIRTLNVMIAEAHQRGVENGWISPDTSPMEVTA